MEDTLNNYLCRNLGQEIEKNYWVDKPEPLEFCQLTKSLPIQSVSQNEKTFSEVESVITGGSIDCTEEFLAELPNQNLLVDIYPPHQNLLVNLGVEGYRHEEIAMMASTWEKPQLHDDYREPMNLLEQMMSQSSENNHFGQGTGKDFYTQDVSTSPDDNLVRLDLCQGFQSVTPNQTNRLHEETNSPASVKENTQITFGFGHEITRDVIELHTGKKLEDVANILGVSRSTFKRICRKNNISRWPSRKREKVQNSHPLCKSVVNAEDCSLDQLDSNSNLNKADGSTALYRTSMTVKATYGSDMIKFQLYDSSKMMDLVEEVTKRLKLQDDHFKAKYLDEDNDLILLACDDDLQKCISSKRSLGKIVVYIVVERAID